MTYFYLLRPHAYLRNGWSWRLWCVQCAWYIRCGFARLFSSLVPFHGETYVLGEWHTLTQPRYLVDKPRLALASSPLRTQQPSVSAVRFHYTQAGLSGSMRDIQRPGLDVITLDPSTCWRWLTVSDGRVPLMKTSLAQHFPSLRVYLMTK